jgi:hypothetical protein
MRVPDSTPLSSRTCDDEPVNPRRGLNGDSTHLGSGHMVADMAAVTGLNATDAMIPIGRGLGS